MTRFYVELLTEVLGKRCHSIFYIHANSEEEVRAMVEGELIVIDQTD
jgi:hypothetical protein